MSKHPYVDKARRRANEFAAMTDAQFAEAYVETLRDTQCLHFSPYLVTAVREINGMWERLTYALAARRDDGK